jgi:hypothetical protein
VVLLVMVNDNRERALHRRWLELAADGAALPPVATTSYRKLRSWPAEGIWRPLTARGALSVPLHRLARGVPLRDSGFGDPGALPDRPSATSTGLVSTDPK